MTEVVIVGAGCFGISTALHLLLPRTSGAGSDAKHVKYNVTVLDRSSTLPAPDAASTDLNKVIRSSYHDGFYTRLAREAIHEWKDHDSWGDCYHECGVLVLGTGESIYADGAFLNDISEGAKVQRLLPPAQKGNNSEQGPGLHPASDSDGSSERPSMPLPNLNDIFDSAKSVRLGPALLRAHAYINYDGGWAHAEAGVARAMERVRALGGKVLAGKKVVELLKESLTDGNFSQTQQTRGVRCEDGSEYTADIVVLATGAWTALDFPSLLLNEKCLATGQSVCTVQLTQEEADAYRSIPVILDFGPSGFYMFPPNDHNVVKFAKHTGGYANFQNISSNHHNSLTPSKSGNGVLMDILGSGAISTPRTISSHGEEGLKIPLSEAQMLRASLHEVFPDLAEKPVSSTRLCWYTDSPDSDWIIDVHPSDSGLVLATAGSGHAYKFLPIIGRLVVERIENRMPSDVRARFAVDRPRRRHDLYRAGAPIRSLSELDPAELVGPAELKNIKV